MKILAVTLYSGENEFDACIASIRAQSHPPAEHLIVRNLPKREAHEKMFGTFMRRRDEFDLLVKVDADMILRSNVLFAGIVARFCGDARMQVLSIKVHDYFTDRLISGLNTYRNTVRWSANGDGVFTDRFDFDHTAYVRNDRRLAPAATHCGDPGPFQAFHFGVHRGVKAAVARERGMYETMYMRHRDVEMTWRHFLRKRERRLGLAALGGELGMQGRFDGNQLDYDNPVVRAAFEEYHGADADRLEREVRQLRRGRYGAWPWLIRMELCRGGAMTPLRCVAPLPMRKATSMAAKRLGAYLMPWKGTA